MIKKLERGVYEGEFDTEDQAESAQRLAGWVGDVKGVGQQETPTREMKAVNSQIPVFEEELPTEPDSVRAHAARVLIQLEHDESFSPQKLREMLRALAMHCVREK